MKTKTIKTSTHLLLVLVGKTVEIKNNNWILDCGITKDEIRKAEVDKDLGIYTIGRPFKIIAASPKLGDLPEFKTLLPNTEDDVEKLAMDIKKEYINTNEFSASS